MDLPFLVKVAPSRFKENAGKKKKKREESPEYTWALGFGGCRRVLGAQPPVLCPLTKAVRADQKCSCARPDSRARGDHLQTKLFQFNNRLTAQSCRKEEGQGPKSPLCGFQPGDARSAARELTCYGARGVRSAARTWTAASPEADWGEQGSRGTAPGYSGSGDVAGTSRQPVRAPGACRPAP